MALATTHRTTAPFALIDRMLAEFAAPAAPQTQGVAYDLVKTGEDRYRLVLPVTGFAADELEIESRDDRLEIRGRPGARAEGETVLHRGIPQRAFERSFTLGEHVRVEGAKLAHGLLAIELVREVPEALRPRTIAIDKAA